jgi:HK97 family phage portal protein
MKMGLIDRIKTYFFTETGQRVDYNARFSWFNRLFGYDIDYTYGDDSKEVVNRAYGSNPYFFMIVDRISSIIAALPREVIDLETGKPIEKPTRESLSLEQLLNKPNSFESSYDFYYRMSSNLLLGNLYVYKELPAGFTNGLPSMLLSPISSDVVIDEPQQNTLNPEGYSFTYQNVSFNNISPEYILHLKRPNIIQSTHYGLSTLKPSAPLWSTSNEIFKSGYALHKNKGIQGVLHGKGGTILRPDEQKQLQEYYDSQFGNNEKAGKVKISSTELGYIPMGVNPADLQSVQMNLDLLRATCAMFGAPSQLFGDVAASTYSNMEQAERAFYMNSILPLTRRIDTALNYWLIGEQNFCYKVNENQMSIVQDLKTDLINNSISLYNAGMITLEEARLMVNEDFEIVPDELNKPPEMEVKESNEAPTTEGEEAPTDANAEAQARLRGSVGGVQGLLEIQAAVSAGTTTYSAAITILTVVYGFDEQTAREMLGDESEIQANLAAQQAQQTPQKQDNEEEQ